MANVQATLVAGLAPAAITHAWPRMVIVRVAGHAEEDMVSVQHHTAPLLVTG